MRGERFENAAFLSRICRHVGLRWSKVGLRTRAAWVEDCTALFNWGGTFEDPAGDPQSTSVAFPPPRLTVD